MPQRETLAVAENLKVVRANRDPEQFIARFQYMRQGEQPYHGRGNGNTRQVPGPLVLMEPQNASVAHTTPQGIETWGRRNTLPGSRMDGEPIKRHLHPRQPWRNQTVSSHGLRRQAGHLTWKRFD